MDFKNVKEKIRDPKVLRLLPNVCDFQKIPYLRVRIDKTIENLEPSLWILFFVISISVQETTRTLLGKFFYPKGN
jgi:hypothetical protein